MAKLKNEDIINSIKEMTMLELKELVDLIKSEFGVDPSAVAVAAPTVEVEVSGPSVVNLELTAAGLNKIAVIKLIRDITGLGLKEAKDIADAGGVVKEKINADEAAELKAKFEEAGATVELK